MTFMELPEESTLSAVALPRRGFLRKKVVLGMEACTYCPGWKVGREGCAAVLSPVEGDGLLTLRDAKGSFSIV